jgi:hypothetical protein
MGRILKKGLALGLTVLVLMTVVVLVDSGQVEEFGQRQIDMF